MKKILYVFLSVFCLALYSCEKEKDVSNEMVEAELRLGGPDFWILSDANINGVFLVKNKIVIDSSNYTPPEYFSFDTETKTIDVKYHDEKDVSVFNYKIVGDKFSVYVEGETGTEEVMTIKSGSVFDDHFILEEKIDNEINVYKLVPKK
jgi:hypothetical protein